MKSVLLSIKPKYCELIANGKKTVEVRKARPKIETPFKCYIYQSGKALTKTLYGSEFSKSGYVIGEFEMCNTYKGKWNKDGTRSKKIVRPPQSWCYVEELI